jgi:hypothetical protein
MSSTAHNPACDFYRVEVSGWDTSETYFVEKAELEWNDQSGKQLALRRMLREGAIIFVRLLQALSPDGSLAVPYQARFAGTQRDGQNVFRINPAQPRERNREYSAA